MRNPDVGYFEGILQLRNPRDDILEFIRKTVRDKKGVSIAAELSAKNGVDIYITSQHFLQGLGRKLEKKFGGKSTAAAHLQTRSKMKSKNLYRINVCYTVPQVLRGDIVCFDSSVGRVLKVAKKVTVSIFGGGKKVVALADLIRVVGVKTKVCKTRPVLEVLHPETYQSVEVENTADVRAGQNVLVVMWGGKVWIV